MKHLINFRSGLLLATGVGVGLFLSGTSGLLFEPRTLQAQTQQKPSPKLSDGVAAQLDFQTLSERSPDQSHAIADVGYHLPKLWVEHGQQNWPLVNYYR